jgi:hypothetical protein
MECYQGGTVANVRIKRRDDTKLSGWRSDYHEKDPPDSNACDVALATQIVEPLLHGRADGAGALVEDGVRGGVVEQPSHGQALRLAERQCLLPVHRLRLSKECFERGLGGGGELRGTPAAGPCRRRGP